MFPLQFWLKVVQFQSMLSVPSSPSVISVYSISSPGSPASTVPGHLDNLETLPCEGVLETQAYEPYGMGRGGAWAPGELEIVKTYVENGHGPFTSGSAAVNESW